MNAGVGSEVQEDFGHEFTLPVRVDRADGRAGQSAALLVDRSADGGVECCHDALDCVGYV